MEKVGAENRQRIDRLGFDLREATKALQVRTYRRSMESYSKTSTEPGVYTRQRMVVLLNGRQNRLRFALNCCLSLYHTLTKNYCERAFFSVL